MYMYFYFILDELLKSTAEAVDALLDLSDELCQEWSSTEMVEGLLEAVRQIG